MGGAQSTPTRKLTIPNEESNIIKVSESVAERLKKCAEKAPEDYMKQATQAMEPPPSDCPPLPEFQDLQNSVRNKENMPYYPGDPLMNFYYGPSVTSLRILQEKEKELKESEDYWTKRIQNMEQNHSKLSEILENEYRKAVEEVSNQSPRPPPDTPFPCCEQKQKLIECYLMNPNEVLLCAGEVTEFTDCVHSNRLDSEKQRRAGNPCEEKTDETNNGGEKKGKEKNNKEKKNKK